MLTMSTSASNRDHKSDYHHGNLRKTLTEQAVKKIKKEGMAKLNLRDLVSICGSFLRQFIGIFKAKIIYLCHCL